MLKVVTKYLDTTLLGEQEGTGYVSPLMCIYLEKQHVPNSSNHRDQGLQGE